MTAHFKTAPPMESSAARSLSLGLPEALSLAASLMREGKLTQAERLYLAVLDKVPEQFEALLGLGRLRLRRGNAAAALDLLQSAANVNPRSADAQLELGNALAARDRHEEAIAAFRGALALRPRDAGALAGLGVALQELRRLDEAIDAYRQALALNPRLAFAHNNLGTALGHLQRFDEAVEHFRLATIADPNLAQAFDNLATALRKLGRLEEAVAAYRQSIRAKPDNAATHNQLGNTLQQLGGRGNEAIDAYKAAIALAPDSAAAYHDLANALFGRNRTAEALACYERAIELKPDFALAYANMGLALQQIGRRAKGIAAFERALELEPENIEFHYKMSDSKRFTAADAQLATLERLSTRAVSRSADEQVKLHFMLGKAYDEVGRHEAAFDQLSRGNRLMRQQLSYDPDAVHAYFERIRSIFTADMIRTNEGAGHPSAAPIFILGMPRSGTTLAEQILAGHPQVYAAGELSNFALAATAKPDKGRPNGYPELARTLDRRGFFDLGATYLASLPVALPLPDRITDKMPGNFSYVGLIHLALPNARIIHIRRDPLDTCFSLYSKLFIAGQPFSYDLEDIGRYYRDYQRLMAHWEAVLPEGRMIEVQYEDMVGDLEGQARRMVAHCGLEWDPRCLAFQNAKRTVRTASFSQVREPLYATSVGRAQPYRDMLRPLIKALAVVLLAVLARPPAHGLSAVRHLWPRAPYAASVNGAGYAAAMRATRSDARSRRRRPRINSRAASIWPLPTPASGTSVRNLASMSAQAMPRMPAPLGA